MSRIHGVSSSVDDDNGHNDFRLSHIEKTVDALWEWKWKMNDDPSFDCFQHILTYWFLGHDPKSTFETYFEDYCSRLSPAIFLPQDRQTEKQTLIAATVHRIVY